MMEPSEAAKPFEEFVAIIKALRMPGSGCPWDLEQNHQTLRPYLIEEAYEVLDAIDVGDDRAICEELGDLLLQVVLHAQVADDRGAFSLVDVLRGIAAKMVRRHPHVFGSTQVSGSEEVRKNWDQIKASEKQAQGEDAGPDPWARLPRSLPALLYAQRLEKNATREQGKEIAPVVLLDQLQKHFAVLDAEVHATIENAAESPAGIPITSRLPASAVLGQQLGDVLFSLCRLAARIGINAEDCLRASCQRFVQS